MSLNQGVAKSGKMYCKHPFQLIRDLLNRQKEQQQINLMLDRDETKNKVGLGGLRNEQQTVIITNLIRAASVLVQPSYEGYKSEAERAL